MKINSQIKFVIFTTINILPTNPHFQRNQHGSLSAGNLGCYKNSFNKFRKWFLRCCFLPSHIISNPVNINEIHEGLNQ